MVRQSCRLLLLAAIYEGATRTEAAKIGGVGLQIVRDRVLRFNEYGAYLVFSTVNARAALKAQ